MSDHASAASMSAKSQLSLPGPDAHASSTDPFFTSSAAYAASLSRRLVSRAHGRPITRVCSLDVRRNETYA